MTDLLDGVAWTCAAVTPGTFAGPAELGAAAPEWLEARVPGTVASAWRAAGRPGALERDYDGEEWWYRCTVTLQDRGGSGEERFRLVAGGLAGLAELYLDGELVARSEDQFLPVSAEVSLAVGGPHELCIRFRSLAEALRERRPRPRWKTYLVAHQNLRFVRTALLGRLPGWAKIPPAIGPVAPVRLQPLSEPAVLDARLVARVAGEGGVVDATVRYWTGRDPAVLKRLASTRLGCAGVSEQVTVQPDDSDGGVAVLRARLRLRSVERWWPASHGNPVLYAVELLSDDGAEEVGRVGFRTVEVDRSEGRFSLKVNGTPVFCGGATWFRPDPVAWACSDAELERAVADAVEANMNMLRVPAVSGYEEERFFELCDSKGVLVWQECPFAFVDVPATPEFEALVTHELRAALSRLGSHASLAVVCGGQQTEEIPAMNGLEAERYAQPLFSKVIPGLCAELAPGAFYVPSEPSGGALPLQMDSGVSQYFGVGGYMRPLSDVRRAGVRFAAECLALSTPPPAASVEELGGAHLAGHDPAWKLGVHHDAGRSWDMEDVRDFYMRELFGIDPLLTRYVDPGHALELGRATNAELVAQVFTEWRRPGSGCGGGLVLGLRDLRLGAGFGLVDANGRRKAPWYALRRVLAPVAVLVTDEGLNGLRFHIVNDRPTAVAGTLSLELYTRGSLLSETASSAVEVPARGHVVLESSRLLPGFRDVSYAFRFAPPAYDVVVASLVAAGATAPVAEAVHLPLGLARPREEDIGLAARMVEGENGTFSIEVTSARLAEYAHFELSGGEVSDDWFHVVPGRPRRVSWRRQDAGPETPMGVVRAINAERPAVVTAP